MSTFLPKVASQFILQMLSQPTEHTCCLYHDYAGLTLVIVCWRDCTVLTWSSLHGVHGVRAYWSWSWHGSLCYYNHVWFGTTQYHSQGLGRFVVFKGATHCDRLPKSHLLNKSKPALIARKYMFWLTRYMRHKLFKLRLSRVTLIVRIWKWTAFNQTMLNFSWNKAVLFLSPLSRLKQNEMQQP